MKNKLIPFLILSFSILVSCTTLENQNNNSYLRNMGKTGDVVITCTSDFLDISQINSVDRLNIVVSKDEINGCVEGNFSKFAGKIASSYINFDSNNLDYYQPGKGLFVFSSSDAKNYSKTIYYGNEYIDDLYIDRIEKADFALFGKQINFNNQTLSVLLVLIKEYVCTIEIVTNDNSSAKGLLTALKSSYVSYCTKNGIKIDYKQIANNFLLIDNKIFINNIEYDDYIKSFVGEVLNYGR